MAVLHARRLVVAGLFVSLLTTAAVLSRPSPACACSCGLVSPAEAFRQADAVFVGRLVDRQVDHGWPLSGTDDKAVLTFEVGEVYKGRVRARQEIVTAVSGASCGLELTGPGPFAVYARSEAYRPAGPPAKDQYAASLCAGSAHLSVQVGRDLDRRERSDPVPSSVSAGSSEPGPIEAGPVSILAWLAALGAALAALVRWVIQR